jgi:hypothetical protein
VGERTEHACRELLLQQVENGNIFVANNAPFSATLADSYRIGIERGRPWTLCIDADVLVTSGAVRRLVEAASRADATVCEIQGLVLDKFFGVRRPAGNHLYRTSLLPKALDLIPREGTDIRPEHHTLNRMAAEGHPWNQTSLVVGVHDFEQSYRDIFRKCYVHARKHLGLVHPLVEYWRTMASHDGDFRMALKGLAAGIADIGEARVDVRRDCGFSKWVSATEEPEKETLLAEQITPEQVDHILASWPTPGAALERFAAACVADETVGGKSRGASTGGATRGLGPLRMLPWSVGRVLGRVGRRLERLANL